MTETLYKILNEDGSARMGKGSWHLPKGKRRGKWMTPIKGDLIPCENGYHLCREQDLLEWLGPAIFTVEYRGERIDCTDKIVVRKARLIERVGAWNERTARLFACDCAERALRFNDDPRCKNTIAVARRFANGEATSEEMSAAESAAWSAGRSAAESAAESAAWSAAESAAESAAWSAARSAAWSAARSAAWSAARSAARSAEQEWQTKRLIEYLTGKV